MFGAETTNGPDHEFDWVVQNYGLDLNVSDKFFLWLFEGGPSALKNASANSQTSGFFYISPVSTTTTSSSPFRSSSTIGGSNATSNIPPNNSSAGGQNSSAAGSELSAGAKAGIGVGAGVVGLAIVSAILLFAKYRSKKRKELKKLQSAGNSNPGDPNFSNMSKTAFPSTTVTQQPPAELLANQDRPLAELG